jgi:hypothetical protein
MGTHRSRQPIGNINARRKGNSGFSFDLPSNLTGCLEAAPLENHWGAWAGDNRCLDESARLRHVSDAHRLRTSVPTKGRRHEQMTSWISPTLVERGKYRCCAVQDAKLAETSEQTDARLIQNGDSSVAPLRTTDSGGKRTFWGLPKAKPTATRFEWEPSERFCILSGAKAARMTWSGLPSGGARDVQGDA